jgi:hypothetical protein
VRKFGGVTMTAIWTNMLRTVACATVASAVTMVFLSSAFAAASVTNRDEKDHKVTIIEGETKKDYTLKPNEELRDICTAGCVLRLNDSDDDEYQLEAKDIVSIEDSALYYDNADEPEPKAEEPKKQ